MGTITRRRYDKDFKLSAVRLVIEGNRKISDVARDLGITEKILSRWKAEYLTDIDGAFPGSGHLKPEDENYRRLRRELDDVKQERDILKKALAIFSKERR